MRSHNDSIDTTHTPPPLSFYNTFKFASGRINYGIEASAKNEYHVVKISFHKDESLKL